MENRVFYIALGDSLTEGVGASNHDKSFAASFFQAIKQTKDCQYINFGKSGRSSGELLEFVRDSKIQDILKKATLITMTTGGIDMIRAYGNTSNILEYARTIQMLKQNLSHILQIITEINPNAQVFIMGLYNPGTLDHKLYSLAQKLIQGINKLYEETAKQFGIYNINPMDSFRNKPHLLADEVHPNDLGYRVITDLFLNEQKFSIPM
ncbi:GDSL-type esterase/lipase family protein [Bacillus sp. V3-13]|uniref:GDSL-type esterase/lipase family protein n=1 Tax=Bacillus sp. V3-13 TaxID=2053728 RepID=UPI0015E097EE|nr:GDSL-type esterase/lipase family protein [Bacillus sp. V3-13]